MLMEFYDKSIQNTICKKVYEYAVKYSGVLR